MKKIYAFYFPQLHPIPENDEWWGKDFTDWKLVKSAKPLFDGHYQPRVPLSGYYDQSIPDVISAQVELATSHAVSGFNFYHYWFDGRVLLDRPIQNLLQDGSIVAEFMLTWANESWTRQWVGRPNDFLIRQKYTITEAAVTAHYRYLSKFFADWRYVKVDGRPVFCIYRPELVDRLPEFIRLLDRFARNDGFPGIYFLACRSYELAGAGDIYQDFSGVINFNPRFVLNKYLRRTGRHGRIAEGVLRRLPESVQAMLASFKARVARRSEFQYADFVDCISFAEDAFCYGLPAYSSVFPDWDNTPRYGPRATLFKGACPELFGVAVRKSLSMLGDKHQPWVFLNAWNEWSESAYLEPDVALGKSYLNQLSGLDGDSRFS